MNDIIDIGIEKLLQFLLQSIQIVALVHWAFFLSAPYSLHKDQPVILKKMQNVGRQSCQKCAVQPTTQLSIVGCWTPVCFSWIVEECSEPELIIESTALLWRNDSPTQDVFKSRGPCHGDP